MACLWLTLADPEPVINGQFLYSEGLIAAVGRAGARPVVLGLEREGGKPRRHVSAGVEYILAEEHRKSRWSSLLSSVPTIALRCLVPGMQEALESCLARPSWEAIVFDSIAAAWALPAARRHRARWGSKLVYLSHNHEAAVASRIAAESAGWRGIARRLDAWKVRRLEKTLMRDCDVVTANSPADCRAMEAVMSGGRPVHFLPPGYGGTRVATRRIDGSIPRRAVVVGSFDWLPKRQSLEAFLTHGAQKLADAHVELQIVGGAEEHYLAGLRQRYPRVEFTGRVADVRPYLAGARVALVPDLLGGFKLKTLDYVFNRLPIFAMAGAVPGTPLEDGVSIRFFPTHEALADGIVRSIDDLDALNRQQELAYAACADRFDWDRIGEVLLGLIRSAPGSPAGSAPSRASDAVRPAAITASPRAHSVGD